MVFSFSSLAGTQSTQAYEVLLRSRKGGGGTTTVLVPGVKDPELKPVTLRKTIVMPSGCWTEFYLAKDRLFSSAVK